MCHTSFWYCVYVFAPNDDRIRLFYPHSLLDCLLPICFFFVFFFYCWVFHVYWTGWMIFSLNIYFIIIMFVLSLDGWSDDGDIVWNWCSIDRFHFNSKEKFFFCSILSGFFFIGWWNRLSILEWFAQKSHSLLALFASYLQLKINLFEEQTHKK